MEYKFQDLYFRAYVEDLWISSVVLDVRFTSDLTPTRNSDVEQSKKESCGYFGEVNVEDRLSFSDETKR